MKVKFVNKVVLGHQTMEAVDVLELVNLDYIAELNDYYYILVYKGIRYDIHKQDVEVER